MTKPDGIAPSEANDGVSVSPLWGTWEELLLAFAVNRYGTGAWDSIAEELQKRTSEPNLPLTAETCRVKYGDLKRRFPASAGDSGDKSTAEEEDSAPLLEELRKLRLAELRREVQRYDLNIESLELKVKKMEEERGRSESDLEKKSEETRDPKPEAAAADAATPVAVDELDKEQSSVNESNSTDPEAEKPTTGEKVPEPVRTAQSGEEPEELKHEPDRKSVRSDSCNGSSNSIEKEPDGEAKAEPVESEAESDGGAAAAAAKESSDVQSSASRSRKEEEEEGRSDKVRRRSNTTTTSGDERDHEDQSRAVKELPAESQPLVDFLKAITAHKLGSVFQRRLRSQDTSKYQKTIRQHLDLETIETRLKEGWYSSSSTSTNTNTKFFRDLLLLVNNALVFFAKNSSEANAAKEIRRLISKEMSRKKSKSKSAKSDSSSGKQISLQSLSTPTTTKKDEPAPSNSLPRLSTPLIVCRKRSSIAAKASSSSDKKKEQKKEDKYKDDNTNSTKKLADEPKITKKRTRDNNRFSVPTTTSKKNNDKKTEPPPPKNTRKGGVSSSSHHVEPKSESNNNSNNNNNKSKNQSSSSTLNDSKKKGAANFLSRMKQGSSSSSNNNNNGANLLDALKNTPLTTSESSSGKGSGGKKKEPVVNTRRGSTETRQANKDKEKEKEKEKEKGSPGKRNVGRPPKRGAVKETTPTPVLGKRGSRGETDTPPASKQQPKKRTRKL